jgi:hypothetical protein
MTKSEIIKWRNTIRIGLEMAAKEIDDFREDKSYKRLEDKLILLYLDIAKLRNMRKELGLK